jgi:hypothetical protein
VLHAMHDELVDQDFAAGAGAVVGAQHCMTSVSLSASP